MYLSEKTKSFLDPYFKPAIHAIQEGLDSVNKQRAQGGRVSGVSEATAIWLALQNALPEIDQSSWGDCEACGIVEADCLYHQGYEAGFSTAQQLMSDKISELGE